MKFKLVVFLSQPSYCVVGCPTCFKNLSDNWCIVVQFRLEYGIWDFKSIEPWRVSTAMSTDVLELDGACSWLEAGDCPLPWSFFSMGMCDSGEVLRPEGDNFNLSCFGVGWPLELLKLDLGQCTAVACGMTWYVGNFTVYLEARKTKSIYTLYQVISVWLFLLLHIQLWLVSSYNMSC